MPFSQLGLHADLVRAVKDLGFTQPTPIQAKAIPAALQGRDVLGGAQTGGGKTAAFALPVLQHLLTRPGQGIRALVLVPTRELAAQVDQTFVSLAKHTRLRTAVVIGGVGFTPQVSAARRADVLIATPGRLLDHLKQRSFRLDDVQQLVLDEADRMLDMGFLPDIKNVIQQLPRDRQTQLFSATLAPEVERIAAFALRDPLRVEIEKPSTVAEGISQILYPVVQSQKAGLLIELLKATEIKSALVFTRTKHGADKLAKKLMAAGHNVGVLHGNRSQNQRTQAMEGFRHGKLRLLVATDIAARGIDVKGVSHVINYDVPRAPEDYVHRVGRTARAYGVGDAVTFMDPSQESGEVRDIERHLKITFPRAVLPDFQYNNPPAEPAEPRRREQPHQRHQPRRDDRRGDGRGWGGRGGNDRRPFDGRRDAPRRDGRGFGGRPQGDGRRNDGRGGGQARDNGFRGDRPRNDRPTDNRSGDGRIGYSRFGDGGGFRRDENRPSSMPPRPNRPKGYF